MPAPIFTERELTPQQHEKYRLGANGEQLRMYTAELGGGEELRALVGLERSMCGCALAEHGSISVGKPGDARPTRAPNDEEFDLAAEFLELHSAVENNRGGHPLVRHLWRFLQAPVH